MRQVIQSVAPDAQAIRLFGSRLNEDARGGNVDLMLDFNHAVEYPAMLSAQLAVRASCAIGGREVDIVLRAPQSDAKCYSSHCRETRIVDLSMITPQAERLLFPALAAYLIWKWNKQAQTSKNSGYGDSKIAKISSWITFAVW